MLDIAPFLTATSASVMMTVLVIIPIAWVAAFNIGPRGKTARRVLSMILRNHPPK